MRIPKIFELIVPFVLFGIIIWIAHYWDFRSFGLYEDDHYRIPTAMRMTVVEYLRLLAKTFFHFGGQGRPLHPLLIYGLSSLASQLGGLVVIYLTGFTIVLVNALLFYLFLLRLSDQPEFALLGGLAYCVFPADTTQMYITHSLGLQPSLTILLISFHLYLSGRVRSSYLLIFCSLFIYETVFPVFLAAPLLRNKWNSPNRKKVFQHVLIMGLMVVFVLLLRRATGEERVTGIGILEGVLFLTNPVTGPITSIAMFLYRPIYTITQIDERIIALVCLSFGCITVVLWRLKVDFMDSIHGMHKGLGKHLVDAESLSEAFRGLGWLLVVGLVMLILAYPLTLTTLGFAVSGRGTRVHMAAGVGASTLFACISVAICRVAAANGKRYVAQLALSAWLALLVGFGLVVQRDYTMGWEFQRSLWTDLVRLCPDVSDGTVILVEPTGLPDNRQFLFLRKVLEGVPDTRQIKYFENPHLTLQKIYEFPNAWKNPAIVVRLPIDWEEKVQFDGHMLNIDEVAAREARNSIKKVESTNVILLETKNRQLTRRNAPIVIGGRKLAIKANNVSSPTFFNRGPLYEYLVRDSDIRERSYTFIEVVGDTPAIRKAARWYR